MQPRHSFFSFFSFPAVVVSMGMLVSGCSLSPSPAELKSAFENAIPDYADEGIRLSVSATTDLNAYHHQPNSCSLFVIQSENRGVLDKLIADSSLLQEIFNGESKAQGILQINQLTLMPGQMVFTSLPRAERARFVAAVAGYYPSPGPDSSFIFAFPQKLLKNGYFLPDYSAIYQPVTITLKLGRLNVVQAEFKPQGDQYMLMKKLPATTTQSPATPGAFGGLSSFQDLNTNLLKGIDGIMGKNSASTGG